MAAEKDPLQRVKDLADAVSTQAHISNNTWFAMITVEAYALLPHNPDTATSLITLPFGFGEAPPNLFYGVIYLLLIVLMIAFCTAHAQQLMAQELAQRLLNTFSGEAGEVGGMPARNFFDLIRKPSLNRVAPLVQLFRRLFISGPKKRLQFLTKSYYALLKIIALLVYFAFPLAGLWLAYRKVPFQGFWRFGCFIVGIIASLALVQIIYAEMRYADHASRHL